MRVSSFKGWPSLWTDSSRLLSGRDRYLNRDLCPLACGAFDIDLSTYEMRAFAHAKQTKRFRSRFLSFAKPSAVVFDREDQPAGFFPALNGHLRGLGMPLNIRQGLLQDAEDRGGLTVVQISVFQNAVQLDGDTGSIFKL